MAKRKQKIRKVRQKETGNERKRTGLKLGPSFPVRESRLFPIIAGIIYYYRLEILETISFPVSFTFVSSFLPILVHNGNEEQQKNGIGRPSKKVILK